RRHTRFSRDWSSDVCSSDLSSVLNIMAITVDHQTCLPPLNLASSGITMTTANFTWTAVSGATSYEYAVTTTATPPDSGAGITMRSEERRVGKEGRCRRVSEA